jgi:electron transport complex protein RnfE
MSDGVNYQDITQKGLWGNNPALVQLLGLCPLLAVSSTVVNALGLGLATLLVLTSTNSAVSLIRKYVSDAVRLPAFVMIIASAVTCIELLMKAFTYELYQILGLFIPLIVTNCAVGSGWFYDGHGFPASAGLCRRRARITRYRPPVCRHAIAVW